MDMNLPSLMRGSAFTLWLWHDASFPSLRLQMSKVFSCTEYSTCGGTVGNLSET
jgi:hypothetical protein